MKKDTPVVHHLKDYQTPQFDIVSVFLEFDLKPENTNVTNVMQVKNLNHASLMQLDGEDLELKSILIDGVDITQKCEQTAETLQIPTAGLDTFELNITTSVDPQGNTALEGLYRTSGNYCTQCEAEGFRKITYFLDRPDVLTLFTTKIIADKADNSVLLSNGNLIESGELENNRHYAVWQDPFKKPCYLFALVAGNLECVQDTYRTLDNRDIDLRIYVEPKNIDKCDHAMASLIKSMKWDEERFGLIYDLDIYMIVAVDDFNMGAMENKGLNVFNSKFVLAKPETATDVDYEGIEAVIGHEYFHNWTGNRVTCRDWFQLTLKEGLTVFRDQEFTADMLSPAVKRIEDVKRLRSNQFPEDAGPMSHPIQPQSYIEMNNFYTMTVYEKGAEVVRLYHSLLGEDGFRKGMDLYFERHDGQAVTVEDFRNAMADANNVDLVQMHQWYLQSGTPVLSVKTEYDSVTKKLIVNCSQNIPKLADKFPPLLMPIKIALYSDDGNILPLHPYEGDMEKIVVKGHEAILKLSHKSESFVFEKIEVEPVVSLLRGFSAPVILEYDQSNEDLAKLVTFDSDSFVRWESIQTLALKEITRNIAQLESGQALELSNEFTTAFEGVLKDSSLDNALRALALTLPEMTYIGEQYQQVNVDAVYHVHRWLKIQLATKYEGLFLEQYLQLNKLNEEYHYQKTDIANRKLKNVCLQYLMLLPHQIKLGEQQFNHSQNMTDVLAALDSLSHTDSLEREACLESFYRKWKDDALVLDKWFALQAASHHIHSLAHVKELVKHPDFVYTNPNRVRSVLGVFGRLNMLGFHQPDGEGYHFLAEQIMKLDAINPQVSARIVAPFTHWQHFDGERQTLMKKALQSILDNDNLSKDTYEIVSKSLSLS
ncbi:aminopeptidase N [Thiomicrorhabdus lithotrophica]|uniref:Aminopeptidase N n=1 Tax=Thiomicrorhabdus lithotrophica TaxID=2949997 RepID=A0ABY8CBL6_9GAMM|nr:aminopeptidase N [Thiomicrorhabdus lithotrophica]WEJ63334.1 aminopeptidase N [Thiomicrorhabdus lithotrophica]